MRRVVAAVVDVVAVAVVDGHDAGKTVVQLLAAQRPEKPN